MLIGFLLSLFMVNAHAQCFCPQGFLPIDNNTRCEKYQAVPPATTPSPFPVVNGDVHPYYYMHVGFLGDTQNNPAPPYLSNQQDFNGPNQVWTTLQNAAGQFIQVGALSMQAWNFQKTRVSGAQNSSTNIQIKSPAEVINQWSTKAVCINIPADKVYNLHVGADNSYDFVIDGEDFVRCLNTGCFQSGAFFTKRLTAGVHQVTMRYMNVGVWGMIYFEVLDNTAQQIAFATAENNPNTPYNPNANNNPNNLNLVWSTRWLRPNAGNPVDTWDYGDGVCPDGFVLDKCSTKTNKMCEKIEHAACSATPVTSNSALAIANNAVSCGDDVQITFGNTHTIPITAQWELYQLDAAGNRIQPAVSAAQHTYAVGQTVTSELYTIFPNAPQPLNGTNQPVKYEVVATTVEPGSGATSISKAQFTVKPIKTQISIINNPAHPAPGALAAVNSVYTIFIDANSTFQLDYDPAKTSLPSNVQWTFPGAVPSNATTNPASTVWNQPNDPNGVIVKAKAQFARGCTSEAQVGVVAVYRQSSLSIAKSDLSCGDDVTLTFTNPYTFAADADWKLYQLDAGGNRIQPAIASRTVNYAGSQSWTGELNVLFPGLPQPLNGTDHAITYEVAVKAGPGSPAESTRRFTINPIKTQIHITNDPSHPGNGPLVLVNDAYTIWIGSDAVFQLDYDPASGSIPNSVLWNFPGGTPPNATSNPATTQWQQGNAPNGVSVTATANFARGCKSNAKVGLIALQREIPHVPNAFTPNGDALNGLFRPLNPRVEWDEFTVYNRWGQIVYELPAHTPGNQGGWNGKVKGIDQKTDVFVWTGKWRVRGDQVSKPEFMKGTVTLIR